MLDLLTGGNGTLAIIGTLALAGLVALWKFMRLVRSSERGKAAIRDNKGWIEGDKHIGEAAEARRITRMRNGDDIMHDDGHKRPSD